MHHLRLVEEADADELHALVIANRAHLERWMPWAAGQTLAGTLEFIRASRAQLADNQGFQVVIVAREEIIGAAGFHRLDWANHSTSIGYWLAETAQGQGIATRTAAALVDHAFAAWGMNRVELRAGTDNASSRAVAERLGFTLEGVLRQAERVGDRLVDHAAYSMLAAEWTPRP